MYRLPLTPLAVYSCDWHTITKLYSGTLLQLFHVTWHIIIGQKGATYAMNSCNLILSGRPLAPTAPVTPSVWIKSPWDSPITLQSTTEACLKSFLNYDAKSTSFSWDPWQRSLNSWDAFNGSLSIPAFLLSASFSVFGSTLSSSPRSKYSSPKFSSQ